MKAERELTSGEGILEYLLEAEELQDGEVDAGVEAQAALVWAQSRVELHTVSAVHLQVAGVVFPDYTELNDSLGNRDNLECCPVLGKLLQ